MLLFHVVSIQVKSRRYYNYKIAAVWKEGAFRIHQVEINDLLEARVFRLNITVFVRPGNQVIKRFFPNLPA